MLDKNQLVYISGTIIISFLIAYFLKLVFGYIRKPNGQKGGIISYHIILSCTLISSIAYLTHDYIYTGIITLLTYLIIRNKLENRQHYLYQIILSVFLGFIPILGILYWKQRNALSTYTQVIETVNDEDERHEAIEHAPELDLHNYEIDSVMSDTS